MSTEDGSGSIDSSRLRAWKMAAEQKSFLPVCGRLEQKTTWSERSTKKAPLTGLLLDSARFRFRNGGGWLEEGPERKKGR